MGVASADDNRFARVAWLKLDSGRIVATTLVVHCLVLTSSNAVHVGNCLFVLQRIELTFNGISLTDHQPTTQLS